MTWTCSKCATRHETEEQRRSCARFDRQLTYMAIGLLAVIIAIALAVKIAWAVYAYGDWTCAFAECRKVVR